MFFWTKQLFFPIRYSILKLMMVKTSNWVGCVWNVILLFFLPFRLRTQYKWSSVKSWERISCFLLYWLRCYSTVQGFFCPEQTKHVLRSRHCLLNKYIDFFCSIAHTEVFSWRLKDKETHHCLNHLMCLKKRIVLSLFIRMKFPSLISQEATIIHNELYCYNYFPIYFYFNDPYW